MITADQQVICDKCGLWFKTGCSLYTRNMTEKCNKQNMEEKQYKSLAYRYRMYFFVPYNISPIQQAIQAGHAGFEYIYRNSFRAGLVSFMENDKTWIILNGGTTNDQKDENGVYLGTLNQIQVQLKQNKIEHSVFHEPDLNNALSAVCFLADERVWDIEKYPDFEEAGYDLASYNHETDYQNWVEAMDEKNLFLRELIRTKRTA